MTVRIFWVECSYFIFNFYIMHKKELIEDLQWISNDSKNEYITFRIIGLIERITKEWIYWDKYKKWLKKINIKSQKGVILNYLQHNLWIEVMWSDFMKSWFFAKAPFIWYSATARLSELLWAWLVIKSWYHKWVMTFLKKSNDRCLYAITEKGLKYKLIK